MSQVAGSVEVTQTAWGRTALVRLIVAGVLHLAVGTVPQAGAQRVGDAAPPFTLGSPAASVVAAQGERPVRVDRLGSLGLEIWHFRGSSVKLGWDDGRVVEWSNADGALNVELPPRSAIRGDTIVRLGGSADPVLRRYGTPDAVVRMLSDGAALWGYRTATVKVSLSDRRVLGWSDPDDVLRLDGPSRASITDRLETGGRAAPPPRRGSQRPLAPTPRPTAPVRLGAEVTLHDASGDGVVEAGERATVLVSVRNDGAGDAHAIEARLSARDGGVPLTLQTHAIAHLRAGERTVLRFEFEAPAELADASRELELQISEGNGFDLRPAPVLVMRTRAAARATLAFGGSRADDQSGDGQIGPREMADVTLRVVNRGPGPAADVRVTIVPDEHSFLAGDAQRERSLGPMAAGEYRDVRVAAYTNSRAATLALTAELRLGDVSNQSLSERFSFPLAAPITRTIELDAPAGRVDEARETAPFDRIERDLPPQAPENPDAIAIVIGVERYRSLPPARYAARDARLTAEYLSRLFGVPRDPAHLVIRTDEDATAGELRKLLAPDGWLARRVTPATEVYVYFSGHGAPGSPAAREAREGAGYLLPFDGDAAYARETGLGLDELTDALAALPARSVNVFLDASFTGRSRGRAALIDGVRDAAVRVEHPALLRPGFAVFMAARPGQIAGEAPELRHGAFTASLLEGLRGGADADADGAITIAELDTHLTRTVRTLGGAEQPQEPLTIALEPERRLVSRSPSADAPPTGAIREAGLSSGTAAARAAIPDEAPMTVTVTQRVLVEGDVTRAGAKRRAIELALADAVRQAFGVRVQGAQFQTAGEDSGGVGDRYLSVVQLDAAGRAVDYRVEREGFVPVRHPALGEQLYYEVELTAQVARERGQRDTGFTLDLTLASPVVLVAEDGAAARSGAARTNVSLPNELVASLTSSRDAWLTVLRVFGDSVTQLLPNARVVQPDTRAGVATALPSAAWRERGLHFRPTLPEGVARRDELLVVIATRSPITFLPPRAGGPGVTAPSGSLLELQRWLVTVPLEDRAMSVAPYEVRRP